MTQNDETGLEIVVVRLEKKDGGDKSPPYKAQAAVPDVLRAHKLEIVDELGKVRITLELDPIMPAAKWMSKAERESLKKSEINLPGGEGKLRARFFAIGSGRSLELVDENSFERVSMAMIGDKPHMHIRDSKGSTVWQARPEKK